MRAGAPAHVSACRQTRISLALACLCADSHHQAAVKELELQQTAVHNLSGQAERLRKEIADAEALAERKRTELHVVTGVCTQVFRVVP